MRAFFRGRWDIDSTDKLDFIDNPEEELAKLEKAIEQYELVLRTTPDVGQQKRVQRILRRLRENRKRILDSFDVSCRSEHDVPPSKERVLVFQDLAAQGAKAPMTLDPEVSQLEGYAYFFDDELLLLFSERNLRLDFQHAIERDGFYHRFQDFLRMLKDFVEEERHFTEGEIHKEEAIAIKQRLLRIKRGLFVESGRFFSTVAKFAGFLIDDLCTDRVICLNGAERIHFDNLEKGRYLEGKTVEESLLIVRDFTREVKMVLKTPNIESRD